METPGDRELRRRKREEERSQIRLFRRLYVVLFGMCCMTFLLAQGLDWLALAVLVATISLVGWWLFVKDR
jgi:hypothetical protein